MAAKSKKPASRGFVNNIILESLISGDKYGYEIIKEVEEKSNGKIVLKQPSLYSSLKRFEAKGYITSYWGDSDIGGRRHYYTITEIGRDYFASIKNGLSDDLDEEASEPETKQPTNVTVEEVMETEKPKKESDVVVEIVEEETQELATEQLEEELVTDPESDEYDVFAILNNPKSATPAVTEKPATTVSIQDDLFSQNENHNELMDEQTVNTAALHMVKEKAVETEEICDDQKEDAEQEPAKEIPLIKEREQEYFNWEELKRKIALKAQTETNKLNNKQPFALQTENEEQEVEQHITSLETHVEENDTQQQNHASETVGEIAQTEITKPKKELKVIVDEFGILKSAEDTAPPIEKTIFDNVGKRLEHKDPVTLPRKKANSEKEIRFEINTPPVQKYNEQEKIVSEKLLKAVESHRTKTKGIDLKNIMGDIMVGDDEVFTKQPVNKPVAAEPKANEEDVYFEEEKPKRSLRATSYSALQDSLKAKGFKFKPYEYELEEERKTDFVLVNKAKFHMGLLLFMLNIFQVSIFAITLNQIGYAFKTIDYIVLGISYGIGALVMLGFAIPYFINTERRKLNNYNSMQALFFGFLSLLSLSIITYAVNAFLGLASTNFSDYIVTLFLPIVVYLLFVIAPLVYQVLVNNKRYY